MLRASGECVINVPTADMLDTVVGVGNVSGAEGDKFERFKLERTTSQKVAAPSLPQCHASLECRIHDDRAAERYNLFILEVLHIDARDHPTAPEYAHYVGDGEFMLSGKRVSRRHLFRPDMLGI
ncbi:flavin reductase family protein [Novosphingobium sp. 9]|uniref:flavin reductase family protein n=1 Tax=Novosphingobium sp. 9 TaxID=2025349 RepID=UPI0021B4FA56|nr:flavin reductase family protein [Novosphingobium sp. 9]